jgi:hypothetical protein
MTNFLGIKQVKRATFNSTADELKLGYLWLVNNGTSENPSAEYDLYFGTRKYGSNADNAYEFINKVITTFGGLLDPEGGFIFPVGQDDFINVDESQVTNLYELLKALDAAIATKVNNSSYNSKVTELQEAIDKCLTGVNVVISETETITGNVADGVVTIDLSEAFAAAGKVQDVMVDGVTVVENGIANISITGKADNSTVTALAERVEALEGFEHADDVVYDSESKTIYLTAGGEKLGNGFSAADFLVDGMLDSVAFEVVDGVKTNNLVFTFNTEAGKESFTVDFSKYVDTYHADGETIELDSTTNTFSFKEAGAEKINVNQIPVGGTPLADVLTANGITSIDAGNLQTVLEALFSQNVWAEDPKRNVPTALTTTMSAPSISFDKTGTVEVGTSVVVTASAKTASASASITYEGFTYGWSAANDNERDYEGNPSSVSVTGTIKEGSDYKLSFVTNNGFGSVDIADVTGDKLTGSTLVAAEGTNKVTVTATAPTFTATVPAQDAVYACSSLKKTDDEHVVAASTDTTIESKTKTATGNTSVTGAYKLYVGYTDSAIADSDGIKGLSAQTGWTNGSTAVSFGGGSFPAGKVSNIAMPSAWSLKEVKNGMDLVITDNFAKVDTIEYVLPNGDKLNYKVYSNLYGADVAYNSIKIGK